VFASIVQAARAAQQAASRRKLALEVGTVDLSALM
jgi:hypothetical protein